MAVSDYSMFDVQKEKEAQEKVSFTLPQQDDGAIDLAGAPGAAYAT